MTTQDDDWTPPWEEDHVDAFSWLQDDHDSRVRKNTIKDALGLLALLVIIGISGVVVFSLKFLVAHIAGFSIIAVAFVPPGCLLAHRLIQRRTQTPESAEEYVESARHELSLYQFGLKWAQGITVLITIGYIGIASATVALTDPRMLVAESGVLIGVIVLLSLPPIALYFQFNYEPKKLRKKHERVDRIEAALGVVGEARKERLESRSAS